MYVQTYRCDLRLTWGIGTGEHGVGIGKREYLYDELGAGTVGLMKTIKNAIDPLGLFNPGKVHFSCPSVFRTLVACVLTLLFAQLYPDEPTANPHAHPVGSKGADGESTEH